MKNKTIIYLTISLIIILLLAVILFINKNKLNTGNKYEKSEDYYAFVVDKNIESKLIIDYSSFSDEIIDLETEIKINSNIFKNNSYYIHSEEVDFCEDSNIYSLIDNIEFPCSSNNQYDIYIKKPCCNNPQKKFILLLLKAKPKISDEEEAIFKKHVLYNSCKEN